MPNALVLNRNCRAGQRYLHRTDNKLRLVCKPKHHSYYGVRMIKIGAGETSISFMLVLYSVKETIGGVCFRIQ